MLVNQEFACGHCGYQAFVISRVTTDKQKRFISEQTIPCPGCNRRLKAKVHPLKKKDLYGMAETESKDPEILFRRGVVAVFSFDQIDLDLSPLISGGFNGVITVRDHKGEIVVIKTLPLEHRSEIFRVRV